jgi:hypothetical protein
MVATVVTATKAAAVAMEVVGVVADMVAAVTTVVTITSNSSSSPQAHLPARPVRLVRVRVPPAWPITPPNTLSTTDKVLTPTLLMVGTRTMWHTTSITSKPLRLNSNSNRRPLPRLLHQLVKLLLPLPPDPDLLHLLPVEVATVRYESLNISTQIRDRERVADEIRLGSSPTWSVVLLDNDLCHWQFENNWQVSFLIF